MYVTLEPHQASYYGVCRLQVPRRLSQRLAGRLISTDHPTVLPRREHCRPAPRVDRLSDFPVVGPMPSTASRRGRWRTPATTATSSACRSGISHIERAPAVLRRGGRGGVPVRELFTRIWLRVAAKSLLRTPGAYCLLRHHCRAVSEIQSRRNHAQDNTATPSRTLFTRTATPCQRSTTQTQH